MASSINEPFIVIKNYRQKQKETKKECIKEKTQQKQKEVQKKVVKQKKNLQTTQSQQTAQRKLDPNLLARILVQHQQQQQLLQQFIQSQQQINNQPLQEDDLDQYSPVYQFGIPTTPQNVVLQRRLSRDDDDFKL